MSAIVVGAYAALHVANHLAGLAGAGVHRAVMESLRHVYRFAPIEWLLLAAVAAQVVTGLWMFVTGWRRRRGLLPWLQAGSGFVLSGFLAIHVLAILYGRFGLHLDTNLYYAAAGMHVPGPRLFFAPYYFAGVLALFVHVGFALYRLRQRQASRSRQERGPSALAWVGGASALGSVVATLLVLLLAGSLTEMSIPAEYLATFQASRAEAR